jgi:hypothetical protein
VKVIHDVRWTSTACPDHTRTKDGVSCDMWLGGLLKHYRRAA